MKISQIMSDLESINPDIFKDTFLIRKVARPDEGLFYDNRLTIKYSPSGRSVRVGYAGKNSAPWFPAVIIDIIDGV